MIRSSLLHNSTIFLRFSPSPTSGKLARQQEDCREPADRQTQAELQVLRSDRPCE